MHDAYYNFAAVCCKIFYKEGLSKMTTKPLCFVLMPFSKELKPIYEKIKSVAEEIRFECKRSDEIAVGPINKNIFENIFYAKAIIADLTGYNPNVFYELGVAHAISRKVILISQEEKIPFDISGDFVIKYTNTIPGGDHLSRELKRLLEHIKEGRVIDNPAQMFLPQTPELKKINEISDKSKEILIALAKSRKAEMEIIKDKFGWMDESLESKLKADIKHWEELLKWEQDETQSERT
jgi:hypothetical protein